MSLTYNTNTNNKAEETAASALAGLSSEQQQERSTATSEDKSGENEQEEFLIPQRFTKSGRKRAVPFTIKLMKVLSDKKNAHIITWMPSGKSFNILKPKAFVADILPNHFKTAKYSSFTRKLHRWGFMRHYRGEEAGAFYHKDFQRGRLDLVEQMTCHKAEPPKSAAVGETSNHQLQQQQRLVVKPVPVRPAPVPATTTTTMMTPTTAPKPVTTINMGMVPTPATMNTPAAVRTPSLPGLNVTAGLPPMAPTLSTAAAAMDSERLNAAIEAEVNRRLKERINAVALSRQAFAVSALRQQQLALNPPPAPSMTALLLQKQAGLFKNAATLPTMGMPTMGYRALAPEGQPLPGAPPTNIRSARTA